jgi:hypothetical protein
MEIVIASNSGLYADVGKVATLSALLEIAALAAVEAVLAGLDFFFALRRYSNPMLHRGVPVQIAVLDYLAHFEKPRVIGRSWLCLVCRAHAAV